MNKGVTFLMKKHKIEVIEGDAKLEKALRERPRWSSI
jgi:pyruvate/2-oxoglutarate dehydrogenase complex dihydrolipoamide dehydrogenase (E3) component